MKFNVNNSVRVRLTDTGHDVLERNHRALFTGYPEREFPEMRQVVEDANGWSEWQLWDLMSQFGTSLYNGCDVPFETEIEITDSCEGTEMTYLMKLAGRLGAGVLWAVERLARVAAFALALWGLSFLWRGDEEPEVLLVDATISDLAGALLMPALVAIFFVYVMSDRDG